MRAILLYLAIKTNVEKDQSGYGIRPHNMVENIFSA